MVLMNGLMVQNMLGIGKMIRHMVMVKRFMPMVVFMKVIGKKIWLMAKVNLLNVTEVSIMDIGRIIFHMDREQKSMGIMMLFSKDCFTKEKSKDKVFLNLVMEVFMKVNLKTIL